MGDPSPAGGRGGEDAKRFLTFRAGAQLYALPADDVREIVKPPRLAKVPLGPKALLGLGNLRGSVLPVASLRLLLNRSDEVSPDQERVIVLEGQSSFGLMVDAVEALIRIQPSRIKTAEAEMSAGEGELLQGAFQSDDGKLVKVLDLSALLARAFGSLARQSAVRATGVVRFAARTVAAHSNDEILVAFDVAGQEFALPIASVIEVLPANDGATALPHGDSAVLGMVGLRGALLPMLSLQVLLGLNGRGDAGHQMTIVAAVGAAKVGLATNGVREIVRIDRQALEPVPPVIAGRTKGEAKVQSVIKADGGRRLIAVLSPDQLFREDIMNRIQKETSAPAAPQSATNAAERIFLVFSLGGQEYGLAISAVEEVARLPDQVTRLPRSPDFLKGVINLRGSVLPIIDQRRRFELLDVQQSDTQRLVVIRIDSNIAGFIVDGVSEVLRVPESSVDPAPDVAEGARVLEGVINLPESGRMILLLDPGQLLTRTEKGLLDALGRVDEAQSAIDQSPGR